MRSPLAPFLRRLARADAGSLWQAETRLLRALRYVRPPVAVQWIATRACDLACQHCYSHAGPRAAGELTTDEACRLLLDELVHLRCPSLVLAGGEVTLRRDLAELLDAVVDRGLSWSLQTHGGHVRRLRAVLSARPPAMAAVSLDGPEALHDAFRGRSGSFAAALDAIRVLVDVGCPMVVAGTTVTRHNADRLAEIFDIVAASGAHAWGVHLFAPEGRGSARANLMPSPEQLRRAASFVRRKRLVFDVELGDEWGGAGADDPFYRNETFHCGAGRFTCVVTARGEVMPCTTTDPSESAGNVRERPLSVIWTEGFARFRTGAGDDGICSDDGECWLQARHGAGCARLAFGPSEASR